MIVPTGSKALALFRAHRKADLAELLVTAQADNVRLKDNYERLREADAHRNEQVNHLKSAIRNTDLSNEQLRTRETQLRARIGELERLLGQTERDLVIYQGSDT